MRKGLINLAAALMLSVHGQADAMASTSDSPLATPVEKPAYASPAALVATPDGRQLFIACATANQVAVFDTASATITRRIDVPQSPLGLALSKDG